jgi:FtsH-binding integral membrane protein
MNLKKYNPTFFSVLSIIGIIVGIPLGLYGLTLTGGANLIGEVIFAVVIGLLVLLVLDRVLASIFNPKKVSIIELAITSILLIIFLIRID